MAGTAAAPKTATKTATTSFFITFLLQRMFARIDRAPII
jgi:hypothetical protein